MSFADKKGIVVASGFKLQAEAMLDARQQVDTIADRDELVTINAATPGLRVYVKATKKSYVYNGTSWDELTTGAAYVHPTGDGNHHVPATGTSNNGKVLMAGSTAGSEYWKKLEKSDISDFPTSMPTGSSLVIKLNGGTTEGTNMFTFNGSAAKNINITPASIGAAAASHGTHVTYGTDAPKANGTASAGSASSVSRSDHVHPAQTTISGNAGSATKLQTKRTIDGVVFDGTGNIAHYGICSTAAATAAKVVSCDGFVLASGAKLTVKFTVTNTAANPTLNINNTGAKAIMYRGSAISAGYLAANRVYTFIYDGTDYELIGDINTDTNTTYNIGTATTAGIGKLYTGTGSNTDGSMTQDAITDALAGKAPTNHTHTASQITDLEDTVGGLIPTKLPNPYALTFTGAVSGTYDGSAAKTINIPTSGSTNESLVVKLNGGTTEGTNMFTFNGSADKTINITPSSIGAAAASHTHNYAGSSSAGGAANSVKASLVVKLNSGTTEGTNMFTFNGGTAKTINITPSSIGAAAASHTHNYAGSSSAGGAANSAVKLTTARTINDVSFDGSKNIQLTSMYGENLGSKTISLNTLNLSSGSPKIKYYYCATDGDGSKITGRPDDSVAQAFTLKCESIRYASVNDYITKQTYVLGASKITWERFCVSGTWGAWGEIYTSQNKPTASDIGAAASSHNHSAANITSGTLPVARGGTGITANPSLLVNLGSTAAAGVFATSPRPGVTGTLPVAHGGTGATSARGANYNLLSNALEVNSGWSDSTYMAYISASPSAADGALRKYQAGRMWSDWLNDKIAASYAAKSHTHNYAGSSSAGGAANSVKASLIVKLNGGTTEGTNMFTFNGGTAKTINITPSAIGAAASSHNHSAANITSGTLPISRGGTGITSNPSMLTSAASVFAASPRPGVTGTLPVARGGTGATTAAAARSALGAAASSHTHNYAGSSSAGGAATSAVKVAVPVGTVLFSTSSSTTFFSSCFGGTWTVVGNVDAIVGSSSTLTLYMFRKTAA